MRMMYVFLRTYFEAYFSFRSMYYRIFRILKRMRDRTCVHIFSRFACMSVEALSAIRIIFYGFIVKSTNRHLLYR